MVAGRTYCALILATLCCGCMLIVPRGDETFRVDKPALSADRARYVGSDLAGEFPVATKDQVLAAWGKPDAIEPPQVIDEQTTNQGKEPAKDIRMGGALLWGKADTAETPKGRNERWIYKDGRRWKGTWLWILIVPIPLLYPTTNQLAVEYSGESAVAIETVNTSHGSMTFCGLYWFLIPMCASGGQLESDKARFVSTRSLLPNIVPGVITTLAGTAGAVGSTDGAGAAASFKYPASVATDGAGNVYVADTDNGTIRKITPAGVVTTLAGTAGNVGSADGMGATASFSSPRGVAIDTAGNVYVADTSSHAIRKITPGGVVSTLAAGAALNQPSSVAIDAAGDVYVSDNYDNTVRRIAPGGDVSTLAGPLVAGLKSPGGVATDSGGNVYVADTSNNTIRKIVPAASASR